GIKSVPLISSLNNVAKFNLDEVDQVEYRVNYTFDGLKDTVYHCAMFKLPDSWIKEKRHLIRYETLYSPGTEENLHHWDLVECGSEFEEIYLKNNDLLQQGECYSGEWLKAIQHCHKISLVWAVGGATIQDFPEDLAYPMGGPDEETRYFFLEIHFDNPRLKKDITDNSGVRLYGTKNYRKNEFGVFTIGASENYGGLIVPPGADTFRVNYGCSSDCVNKFFEEQEEIKVFSTLPHTHLTGKEIYTKVIRD
ncbi:DBH-like monooxygenase 1, partial [Brachionus plicatilis]